MFALVLFVEGIANPFELHYRGEEQAKAARQRIVGAEWTTDLDFLDDFGQHLGPVNRGAIKVPMLMDTTRYMDMQKELAGQARGGTLVTPPHGLAMPRQ